VERDLPAVAADILTMLDSIAAISPTV